MRIGIYNQPSVPGINGVEYQAAVLAEGLSHLPLADSVDLVHHVEGRSRDWFREYYDLELGEVGLRRVEKETLRRSRLPWRRYRLARSWMRHVSAPYDLFVSLSGSRPPFSHAERGALYTIFPFQVGEGRSSGRLVDAAREAYDRFELDRRLSSYDLHLANSEFTARWCEIRRNCDCAALYPPVRTDGIRPRPKRDVLLSVGRFAARGDYNNKNQLLMARAFRELHADGLTGWRYFTVGPLEDWEPNVRYFEEVCRAGDGTGLEARANLPRPELERLYGEARIFWHAAGHGIDATANPDQAEHFGIVTVEAMAGGCVPVVPAEGGQPEIVEHGVSGFLWNTVGELKEHTLRLARDEELWSRMSEAARSRASHFSEGRYVQRFVEALEAAGMLEGAPAGPDSIRAASGPRTVMKG